MSDLQIAERTGHDRRTAARHHKRLSGGESFADRLRSGRPRVTTRQTDRKIAKLATRAAVGSTRSVAACVKTTKGEPPGRMTVWRRIRSAGIVWRTKTPKPSLTDAQMKKRLVFAQAEKHRDWTKVLYADECKVQLGRQSKKAWVPAGEKPTRPTVKYPTSTNVLACFGHGGYGRIVFFEENLTGAKMAELVEEEILPSAKELFGSRSHDWALMHDNDPKFKSKKCQGVIEELGIELVPQPPQSPDLNPIENAWASMKKKLEKARPNTLAGLKKCVRKAWRELTLDMAHNLVDSMSTRLKLVIKAKGGSIKY